MPKPKVEALLDGDPKVIGDILNAMKEIFNMSMTGNPAVTQKDALLVAVNFTKWVVDQVEERGMLPDAERKTIRRLVADTIYLSLGV